MVFLWKCFGVSMVSFFGGALCWFIEQPSGVYAVTYVLGKDLLQSLLLIGQYEQMFRNSHAMSFVLTVYDYGGAPLYDTCYVYVKTKLQDSRDLFPDDLSCHIPGELVQNLDSIYFAHPELVHFQWSAGDTTSTIHVEEEGTYSVMMFTGCDTITDQVTIHYDAVTKINQTLWLSQSGNQVRLLEEGETEVFNALGQKLLGTKEREFALNPGLYVVRLRSRDGMVRTAKVVVR